MAILCLGRSIKIDFATWLKDAQQDLYLIASSVMPNQDRYRLVRFVDNLDANGVAELAAVEIGKSVPVTHVVPHSEYDLIRAARLREHFRIPGQTVESALAYRDKVTMKEHLRRAGVNVAHFSHLSSPLDALHFVEQHGFPVIIKPVDGCSSKNVRLIAGHSALDDFLRASMGQHYMIESFVTGHMYHVNGLIKENGLSFFIPCTYLTTCLDFQKAGMFGDRTIDPNTQFARRLIEFTKSVITALPPARPLGFHAEVFHTPEDKLLLCEIAARTPGSITGEAIEHSYGINIHRAWIRSLAGLDDDIAPARTPRQYTASIRIPIREGRLVSLPTVIPFPWVSTCCVTGVVGTVYGRATTYTDDVLSALVAGSSDTQLEERIAEFATWLNEVIRWA